MKLPSNNRVHANTPIYAGSNFTWGEATKNGRRQISDLVINGKLIATAASIEQRIIATAIELDIYRSLLGNRPIWINSWYRPASVNARVGGSLWSRHQFGDAVDIRSDYLSAYQVYKILNAVHNLGGLGRYVSFTHVDWRGQKARWKT